MWCNRVKQNENSIVFWFSSGGGYDIYVELFGIYEIMQLSSGLLTEFEYKEGMVTER